MAIIKNEEELASRSNQIRGSAGSQREGSYGSSAAPSRGSGPLPRGSVGSILRQPTRQRSFSRGRSRSRRRSPASRYDGEKTELDDLADGEENVEEPDDHDARSHYYDRQDDYDRPVRSHSSASSNRRYDPPPPPRAPRDDSLDRIIADIKTFEKDDSLEHDTTPKHKSPVLPSFAREERYAAEDGVHQEAKDLADTLTRDEATGKESMTTVGLHNLCDMKLIDLEDWPEFFDDMRLDVEKACRQHGEAVKLWVDETAPKGSVYVRFLTPTMAQDCQRIMDKRCFAGREVSAVLCSNDIWTSRM